MDDYLGLTMFTSVLVVGAFAHHCRIGHRTLSTHTQPVTTTLLTRTLQKITDIIQRDEGKRGIGELIAAAGCEDDLLQAARDMVRAKDVAIVTGFPCLLDYSPPTETDGPLGALAIAKALLVLGKRVRVLTDECNEDVLLACAAASQLDRFLVGDDPRLQLESFPPLDRFDHHDEARLNALSQAVDLVVAIERAGPNGAGKYCTMRCRDMTNIVAPLDLLFEPSDATLSSVEPVLRTKINSIGIGKSNSLTDNLTLISGLIN
jgi:D-glutamate cyclase